MGLYDTLVVKDYPLPDGIKRNDFQTKDLICFLELYELRADGTLWHQEYDTEDRSDPNAEGILRWVGSLARVNHRWVKDTYTGIINFYDYDPDYDPQWVEFNAHLVDGKVRRIERVHEKDQYASD